MSWLEQLTEREAKEVDFAQMYANHYSHGTDGHNRLLLISKLAHMIDSLEKDKAELFEHIAKARRQGYNPFNQEAKKPDDHDTR